MISFDEALDRVVQARPRPTPVSVPLRDAVGARLVEACVAPSDNPAFDNSAMDGYAVGGEGCAPWRIVGEVRAGQVSSLVLARTDAVRIFTGARSPEGAFAVVAQEDACVGGEVLTSAQPVKPGEHIRRQGSEFRVGDQLLAAGARLAPPEIALLASLGMDTVKVAQRPRVALVSTGDEIVANGERAHVTQVFDSNTPALRAALACLGYETGAFSSRDDLECLTGTAKEAVDGYDVVVSSGGVSVGDYDFVSRAVAGLGFTCGFHGVAMKPGKPTLFAHRDDGKAWFGLAGNPQAAMTGLLMFVLPYLDEAIVPQRLTAADECERAGSREEFVPARLTSTGSVTFAPSVGSFSTGAMAGADGLARLTAPKTGAGDPVLFYPFPWSSR